VTLLAGRPAPTGLGGTKASTGQPSIGLGGTTTRAGCRTGIGGTSPRAARPGIGLGGVKRSTGPSRGGTGSQPFREARDHILSVREDNRGA
jgi:hypothetical protein